MNKHLLALAVAAALSLTLAACSDSGDDDSGGGTGGDTGATTAAGGGTGADGNTGTGGDTGAAGGTGGATTADPSGEPPVPSGGGAPTGDTKAGNYIGDFGFGQGVYTIDPDNRLAGLALADDGSAVSLFGDLGAGDSYSGTLRRYTHDTSRPASAGVFGTGPQDPETAGPYSLNFVPGQTVESTDGGPVSLSFATGGQIPPATIASVAGTWSGSSRFCDGEDGSACVFITEVTFDGTSVAGNTRLETNEGVESFENPIVGTIQEYGDVLRLSFNWGTGERLNRYDGLAFFTLDGTGRLVFIGETLDPDTGNPVIASLLSQ